MTNLPIFELEPGYVLKFDPAPYIILRVGMTLDKREIKHPNVVASSCKVFEFKHYRSNGSKFWTSKAGVEYYFVVPKDKIDIIPEKGYSYPKVSIGGKVIVLNCSGGTTEEGWADWVGRVASTLINLSPAEIKVIADNSLTVEECQREGIQLDIENVVYNFVQLAAAAVIRKAINKKPEGKKLIVWNRLEIYRILKYLGRRRFYVCNENDCDPMYKVQVRLKDVDWVATASMNELQDMIPQVHAWNALGRIKSAA